MKKALFVFSALVICVFPLFSQNREEIKRQIDSLQAILNQLDGDVSTNKADLSDNSLWKVESFTDKFDRPTGEKFIYSQTHGTFSNSATTNSDLLVFVGLTKDEVFFQLYEYNNLLVKGEGFYVISMLSNEKEYSFVSKLKQNKLFVIKYDKNHSTKETLLKELLNEGEKKFIIQGIRKEEYKFDLQTEGLNDYYNSIFK